MQHLRLWFCVCLVGLCAGSVASVARADPCEPERAGCFLDAPHGQAGTWRSEDDAYLRLHARAESHPYRALAEEVLFLAIGTTWYVLDDRNVFDWDDPGAKARFTSEGWRFDNNGFGTNFLAHPWSGAAYFAAARMNDLSLGASILYGFGASFVWEFGIEFREKVSINDVISTGSAGLVVGEFFSRLAWYVNRPTGARTRLRRTLGFGFGTMRAVGEAIDRRDPRYPGPSDRLGYSADLYHRFTLRGGYALSRAGGESLHMGELLTDGAFVAFPSYMRPGNARRWFHDGDVTRLSLGLSTGRNGAHESDFYADTVLAGFYEQRIDPLRRGHSLLVGTAMGYRYRRSFFPAFRDDVSAVHLPGLALEVQGLGPRGMLCVTGRAHPDFAGLRAWAFPAWHAEHPDEIGKTVVARYGYSYSFGLSGMLGAELELPRVRVGATAFLGRYHSKEGLDRSQEKLTRDPPLSDWVFDAEGFVRVFPIKDQGLLLELGALARKRVSRMGQYESRGKLARASVRVGLEF